MSERLLQKKCRNKAHRMDWLSYKLESPNIRGMPDIMFINPQGVVLFVEFKSPDGRGKLSLQQEAQLSKLINQGCHVRLCESETEFDALLREFHNKRPGR